MKYALVNGIILDGTEQMEPLTRKVILVEDGMITAVQDDRRSLKGYEVINLNGKYIMPGLINLHVHLAGSGKPQKKAMDPVKAVRFIVSNPITRKFAKELVASYAKTALFSGCTTIRTVGGIADFDTTIRDEINEGKRVGPRILAGNMAISVPGGHMADSLAYMAMNAEEARTYVDIINEDHPDLIKLMITGGVMDAEVVGEPGVLRMPAEYVNAACERAHALGLKVAAHVESPKGIKVALENGVDSIEHGAQPTEEIMKLFRETGAYQVSTISPALPYALFDRSISHATQEQKENGKFVFDGIISLARECLANGIPVGLGTDTACPYITQYDMWRELVYFVKYCNVTPKFALYSATLNNARLVGIDHLTGSIEAGKTADLIITDNNPLEDLTTLRELAMVIREGVIYDHPKIRKITEVERELDRYL